jgi:hypothetical protein
MLIILIYLVKHTLYKKGGGEGEESSFLASKEDVLEANA